MPMPPAPPMRLVKPLQFTEEERVLLMLLLTELHCRLQLTTPLKLSDYGNKWKNCFSNNANRLSLSLSRSHSKWPQHPNKLVHMGDGQ